MRPRFRLLLSITALLVGCGDSVPTPPSELQGTWVSDGPLYEGLGFTVTAASLTFHRGGEAGPATYDVESVRIDATGPNTRYEIEHRDESGKMVMFRVEQLSQGALRLTNRPEVTWTRGSEAELLP